MNVESYPLKNCRNSTVDFMLIICMYKYIQDGIIRWPGFDPMSDHVGFVVEEVALGRIPLSASVSPANSHSVNCSTVIRHPVIDAIVSLQRES
jgi:hypothetical protein